MKFKIGQKVKRKYGAGSSAKVIEGQIATIVSISENEYGEQWLGLDCDLVPESYAHLASNFIYVKPTKKDTNMSVKKTLGNKTMRIFRHHYSEDNVSLAFVDIECTGWEVVQHLLVLYKPESVSYVPLVGIHSFSEQVKAK